MGTTEVTTNPAEAQKRAAIEQHSRQAEEFADRYRGLDAEARPTCFSYSRVRLDAMLDRLMPREGAGLRLLDLGCGTGHHMARFRGRGYDVAGVDGSAEMLDHARALNPGADVRQSDVDQISFEDASFDVIVCVEVLRYLPDITRCVAEMARVLKPGGVCLTTAAPRLSVNGYALVNRIAALAPVGNLVRLRQYFTTSVGLRRTFRRAGFDRTDVHGVYLGPVNWVERLAPRALPAALRAWGPVDARLADLPLVREFSNMFLMHAHKAG